MTFFFSFCLVCMAATARVFADIGEPNNGLNTDNAWQCRGTICANYDICSDINDCGNTCAELRALCREIIPIESDNCVLPPYPANATYTVIGEQTQPGLLYKRAELELVCPPGYGPDRQDTRVSCRRGKWSGDFPNCTQQVMWPCRNGISIGVSRKCDGNIDCPDGSDETFALCRSNACPSNRLRCTYGACVDGTAPCNDVQECADNSDELLPRCRNDTNGSRDEYTCTNGQVIHLSERCNGIKHCNDGSDETLHACSDKRCPSHLFQCAYGACVHQGSDCNGVQNCADGSDEFVELCRPDEVVNASASLDPVSQNNCVLPTYPLHGTYTVRGDASARPGQIFQTAFLNYSCTPGYSLQSNNSYILCQHGTWYGDIPQCVRSCRLLKHPGVEYRCLVIGNRDEQGNRECNNFEPIGTVARPHCKEPNYYSPISLSLMRCQEGGWDNDPTCIAECGRVNYNGIKLTAVDWNAERGEIPWHAAIYETTINPYQQICGGSIISTTMIISAAHCFWKDVDKKQPASNYAVAVGKLYRGWYNPYDRDAQKSEVSDIRIPPKFQGTATTFQDDIAVVILRTALRYEAYVRPVCLDFDYNFDRRQLHVGKLGKVAGWGLTKANGQASPILRVATLPYVDVETCFKNSPPSFRQFITSDKICAGYTNGTALCMGDSGGGLAFPDEERGIERYYLRGIVSTAPRNDDKCTLLSLTSFTQISKHEHFIKEFL